MGEWPGVLETIVLIGAAVTAAGVLWQRLVGPFVARPIGTVIRREVGEVVRYELKTIENRLGKIERQLSPMDESRPLKEMVMDMNDRFIKSQQASALDRSNLWRVLAEAGIYDRRLGLHPRPSEESSEETAK